MTRRNQGRHLILNAVPLEFDRARPIPIGRLPYEGCERLQRLRQELLPTHLVRRHGEWVEVVALREHVEVPGDVRESPAGDVPRLISALLTNWLVAHFGSRQRRVFRRGKRLLVVSNRRDDNLLVRALGRDFPIPPRLEFRLAYELEVRLLPRRDSSDVLLLLDTVSRPIIDATAADLLQLNVPVENLYVGRIVHNADPRLAATWRLTGRVARVRGPTLELSDHDNGLGSIAAADALLEPRLEVLAHMIAHLQGRPDAVSAVLEALRRAASAVAAGGQRLTRIRKMAEYLSRQEIVLCPGLQGRLGTLLFLERRFRNHEIVPKPPLIFDPSGRRTNRWNQRGLDRHGPYDRYQFTPKQLNVAVICQEELQGRVEQFVEQFLHGVPGVKGGDVGFLRRFALEKPNLKVFPARDASAASYRASTVTAIEHFTDEGETLNLALVQTEQAMEDLQGDANPYLVSKAFFLSRGVAVQHVHFETMNQVTRQRAWSLNNIGLACYAKLGGVPWLLPSDQTVAHELVIGLGSYHDKPSRFGSGSRYVGITTVFTGDGRYLLESRTRAVPFDRYSGAMLEAVRDAVERVRREYAWAPTDPVRLVFHVFKPVKNAEARAVRSLMEELNLAHAEFAFLHIADAHPFLIFDEQEQGVPCRGNERKGVAAPPRGLLVQVSRHEALLCLKGARELKQPRDGHPKPLLLKLHPMSSFRDLTYLGRQAFAFACHSWRSFLPAALPITILYSQLIATNLTKLAQVPGWSDDSIVGRIGRTRWFL